LFEALLQYDPIKRLSAKEALDHPYFLEREPTPTANAFASLPNGATIYPARKLIKDESDPKMMPVSASATQLAEAALAGGNIGALAGGMPASGGSMMAGQGNAKAGGSTAPMKNTAFHHSLLSAVGPSAPPPAPASVGSAGPSSNMNSVGPSNAASSNPQPSQPSAQQQQQQASSSSSSFNPKGGLVGAATANAGRVAKRQKKG
jgi:serine/threonine protein kinase